MGLALHTQHVGRGVVGGGVEWGWCERRAIGCGGQEVGGSSSKGACGDEEAEIELGRWR